MVVMLLMACKKDEPSLEVLADDQVGFDLPASNDVVATNMEIKKASLVSVEMKATLEGGASTDTHYITFDTDTTKINDYKKKYSSSAMLLPTKSYLFYKQTVAIPAGTNVSEPTVLNVGFQTTLRPRTTYVLPIVISAIDGQKVDVKTRKVFYYVFNTGDALYVDHAGFTLTATASSTLGTNTPARAIDATTGTTFWASSNTAALPQWINIDFARNVTFSGIDYFFPTGVTDAINGKTTSAKLETSVDNTNWTDHGTFAIDVTNAERKHTINLPSPTTARYLRFTILAANPYVASATITYNIGLVGGILLRN